MAVTYSLAPDPKWYIADLVGLPLGGGYMATFSSLDKTVIKLVYEDMGGNFPWPYVTIPNVGSLGILFDENGSQGPFYFEYNSAVPDDTYYLEIYDSNGVLQWTIDDFFPPNGGGGGSVTTAISLVNLITNNVMYRNITATANPIASTFTFLAPGAHSGFALTPSNAGPDICFVKNNLSAIDQLTFMPFTLGTTPLTGDVTPAEYLNYTCTNTPTGETFKYVQFPITTKVQNLTNQNVTLTIWARGNSGTTTLLLSFFQFFGDGTLSVPSVTFPIQLFTLSNGWAQYSVQTTVPDVSSMIIGGCHNDALFLQIQYPLDASCSIDFTKPYMCLGNISPPADYITYDMIDSVINAPRTGDVIHSYNYSGSNYVPGGWVQMNDGTIGNPSSNATTRAHFDTFPLYNMLWNGILNTYCPVINSSAVYVGRGASSIADFTANNSIFIPKALGRVLSGADPSGVNFGKVFNASGSGLVVDDTSAFYTGTPVGLSNIGGVLPAPLNNSTSYYLIVVSSNTFFIASTLANAEAGIPITLTTAGSGTSILTSTLPPHPLAQYVGQDTHAQITSEMAAHSHPPTSGNGFEVEVSSGGSSNFIGGTLTQIQSRTGVAGSGTPFNVLQPTTYANYLIKL
jgi:hypothetical protein